MFEAMKKQKQMDWQQEQQHQQAKRKHLHRAVQRKQRREQSLVAWSE